MGITILSTSYFAGFYPTSACSGEAQWFFSNPLIYDKCYNKGEAPFDDSEISFSSIKLLCENDVKNYTMLGYSSSNCGGSGEKFLNVNLMDCVNFGNYYVKQKCSYDVTWSNYALVESYAQSDWCDNPTSERFGFQIYYKKGQCLQSLFQFETEEHIILTCTENAGTMKNYTVSGCGNLGTMNLNLPVDQCVGLDDGAQKLTACSATEPSSAASVIIGMVSMLFVFAMLV